MPEMVVCPSNFVGGELCLFDGKEVMLLEAPANGLAKVKVGYLTL
jgi:hypothetical protein